MAFRGSRNAPSFVFNKFYPPPEFYFVNLQSNLKNIMKKYLFTAISVIAAAAAFAEEKADTAQTFGSGIVLPEIETIGESSGRSDALSLDMGKVQLSGRRLQTFPSMTGEPDLIKALTIQPGVSEGVEGFSGLFVRGGTNDQNLISLDGVPVYQISHLGGLFSSFNTEIVDNVTFYKSAFPANYGGRLSSVVDISTKASDLYEYHGAASLGLTAGMLHITGPIFKGRTGFDLSVRRSWFDVLTAPALAVINAIKDEGEDKTIARYAFTDINARIDHRFSAANRLRFGFYWGDDYLKIGSKNESAESLERSTDRLRWGNIVASAAWDYTYNPHLNSTITAAYTRYKSTYRRESIDEYNDDETQERDNSWRTDRNTVSDLLLSAVWKYEKNDYSLDFGADYIHHHFTPSEVESIIQKDDMTDNRIYSDYAINADEAAAFADFKWEPVAWLGLDAGLRFSAISIYDRWETGIEPRLLANFKIRQGMSVKIGYARMTQFVQQVSDSYVNLPTDSWMPMGKDSDPLVSDQISLGAYYDRLPGWAFSAEGYYKWMDGVAEVNEDYSYGLDKMQNILYGKGRSYGVEFSAAKTTGKLTGTASYGLMWAERKIGGINGGLWYPAKFDNRHKVNILLSYNFNKKISLNASWVFATGNRMTVPIGMYQNIQDSGFPVWIVPEAGLEDNLGVKYYTGRNNVRLPAYHRLDLSASFTRQLKKGRKGVWRVGLYNAYCHMNPIVVKRKEMLNYYGNNDSLRPWNVSYETFSIFPIIPNVSYTYYF